VVGGPRHGQLLTSPAEVEKCLLVGGVPPAWQGDDPLKRLERRGLEGSLGSSACQQGEERYLEDLRRGTGKLEQPLTERGQQLLLHLGVRIRGVKHFHQGDEQSHLAFWLPVEYLEEHGPQHVRQLALSLAGDLPLNSGYASLAFNYYGTNDVYQMIRNACFRYPGMDIADMEPTG
jgi:hypothetical protein